MNINGLTTKEYKQIRDILKKANTEQLQHVLKAVQYELINRT